MEIRIIIKDIRNGFEVYETKRWEDVKDFEKEVKTMEALNDNISRMKERVEKEFLRKREPISIPETK